MRSRPAGFWLLEASLKRGVRTEYHQTGSDVGTSSPKMGSGRSSGCGSEACSGSAKTCLEMSNRRMPTSH